RIVIDKQDRRGLGAGDLLGGAHDVVEQGFQPRGGVHDAANLKQATEDVEFALEGNHIVFGLWRAVGQVGHPHFTWSWSTRPCNCTRPASGTQPARRVDVRREPSYP